jgi:hypothetical protein
LLATDTVEQDGVGEVQRGDLFFENSGVRCCSREIKRSFWGERKQEWKIEERSSTQES